MYKLNTIVHKIVAVPEVVPGLRYIEAEGLNYRETE
jgi:hypothetical protein